MNTPPILYVVLDDRTVIGVYSDKNVAKKICEQSPHYTIDESYSNEI
jgi:hypothetical protein